jgi:hypothetical protein
MLPTGPWPVMSQLAQTPYRWPLAFVDLRRSMAETTTGTNLAAASKMLTALCNPAGSPPAPSPRSPNPHRARRSVSAPPRFPPLEAFRRRPSVHTPAFANGRHQKPFTLPDLLCQSGHRLFGRRTLFLRQKVKPPAANAPKAKRVQLRDGEHLACATGRPA